MHTEQQHGALDFEHIKCVVPLTLVLERYNVLANLRRVGAQQLVGACPIHKGTNKRQFVVNQTTNEWKCFGDCQRGCATFEFVAALENVSIVEAARLIAGWFAIGPSTPVTNHRKEQRRTKMSTGDRPSHKVFLVEDRGEGKDPFWHRVGSAWPHSDGRGLNIQLPSGLSVSGKVSLREYDDEDAAEDAKKAQKKEPPKRK